MDYQNELKRLQEGGSYWKPAKKNAQFKVKAISELEPSEPFEQERSDGTIESKEQFQLKIQVDGSDKIWTFSKGFTPASTYGQLVNLAIAKGNTLNGAEFTVIVKSDGKKNDYTIVI